MRTVTFILLAGFAVISGCGPGPSEPAGTPLSFFVASDEKIEGGRFIDTPDFVRLGYIAAEPDMVVRRLVSVDLGVSYHGQSSVGRYGEPVLESPQERVTWSITMHEADARNFTALTRRAVGKTLLMTLGDVPILAPHLWVPIETEGFVIVPSSNTDTNAIEQALRKLVVK